MKITNVRHRGLRRLVEDGDSSAVPAAVATKPRKIVGFLQTMEREDERRDLPVWNAHQLTGVRAGTWSNERTSLSPDMAIRIEKAFGVSMQTLMRMQNAYDIAQARMRFDAIAVARFVPNTAAAE